MLSNWSIRSVLVIFLNKRFFLSSWCSRAPYTQYPNCYLYSRTRLSDAKASLFSYMQKYISHILHLFTLITSCSPLRPTWHTRGNKPVFQCLRLYRRRIICTVIASLCTRWSRQDLVLRTILESLAIRSRVVVCRRDFAFKTIKNVENTTLEKSN